MADSNELGATHRLCRLFPLPDLVLFPHAILPLHIFEPRYRQMTEDALTDGDRLVTIVRQNDRASTPMLGAPAIEEIACLGRIFQHQQMPDGRFNILLLGLKRVRLTRQIASEKLYRVAEAEVIEDLEVAFPGDARRNDLHDLFREVVSRTRPNDAELGALVETMLPLGPLTDLVAYTLGLPAEIKQGLLAEPSVAVRADTLMQLLGRILADVSRDLPERPGFPPPFSAN